jgi:hypothetical protein
MHSHRLETVIQAGGTLTVQGLPIPEGEPVEVIVVVKEDADGKRYPLHGVAYGYEDPFSPVAADDWETAT